MALVVGTTFAADLQEPSYTPPGNINIGNAPCFVTIGFDDNTRRDGVDWVIDLFEGKKNPAGHANVKTFDGTDVSVSLYLSPFKMDNNSSTLDSAINRLANTSHEVGNHTYDHHNKLYSDFGGGDEDTAWGAMISFLRNGATADQWGAYLDSCEASIDKHTILLSSTIEGFRAPYLEYGANLFTNLSSRRYTYDCSIEALSTDKKWRWPYTLDNGSPDHDICWKNSGDNPDSFAVPATPGLWEVPAYSLLIPSDEECAKYGIEPGLRERIRAKHSWMTENDVHITGYDVNLWHNAELNKTEVLGMLKYNLDVRLSVAGNRAPLFFGAHSDYYVGSWAETYAPNATTEEMRAAITEFVDYALTKPAVRMVSANKIVKWMRNPEAISNASKMPPTDITLSNTVVVEGTTKIALLTASDPNPEDTHTFTVLDGPFTIVGNTLLAESDLAVGDHSVTIKALDQTYLPCTKTFLISVTPEIDTLTTENLIGECLWGYDVGMYESSLDLTIDSTDGKPSVVSAEMTRPSVTRPNLVYAKLRAIFEPVGGLANVTSIQITYKSDTSLTLKLPMKDYESSIYEGHKVELPETGDEYKSVVIRDITKKFLQPYWEPQRRLDLSKVRFLDFELEASDHITSLGNVSIRQIKMLGYKGDVSTLGNSVKHFTKPIAINTLSSKKLNLAVAKKGSYTVSIYSYNGRLLRSVSKNLTAGVNTINMGENHLSAGAVLLKVDGNGESLVSKMVIK